MVDQQKGDLSPIAKVWAGLLATAAFILLLVLTVAAFADSVAVGLAWLFIGDPIAATVLYWIGMLLVLPVAAATGGVKPHKIKPSKGSILSEPAVLAGLFGDEPDQVGVLDLRDEGLLFHNGGRSGQIFRWPTLTSYGDAGSSGLVINAGNYRWMLALNEIDSATASIGSLS